MGGIEGRETLPRQGKQRMVIEGQRENEKRRMCGEEGGGEG